ncbi:MAG: ATP-binding protein [Atopobiaceae bacterium]|nr:ATP-binding protein [Atopobiaceae bacterium]
MVADGRRPFPEALPGMASGEARLGRERIIGSQTGKAGFPCAKTLPDSGWSFQPGVPRAEIEDLATLGFVDRHENVIFVGSPGVGNYAGLPIMLRNGAEPQADGLEPPCSPA